MNIGKVLIDTFLSSLTEEAKGKKLTIQMQEEKEIY